MHGLIVWICDLFALPTRVREIMATQQEINDQLAEIGGALDNIAGDVQGLKTRLDRALESTQGQVDAAVQAELQAVSDGLAPIVQKAKELAEATPDAPEDDTDGGDEQPPADPVFDDGGFSSGRR